MNISAVLLRWKRDLDPIAKYLYDLNLFDEIIIRDHNVSPNIGVYGRFIAARDASNDFIYVQDDDGYPSKQAIRALPWFFEHFEYSRLVNILRPTHMHYLNKPLHTDDHELIGLETMIGWGALFDRRWSSVLDPYVEEFGEDEVLYENADRIFTILLQRAFVNLRDDHFANCASSMDPNISMYMRPGFMDRSKVAREHIQELFRRGILSSRFRGNFRCGISMDFLHQSGISKSGDSSR